MEVKTLNDIRELKLEIPGYYVVEWFEVDNRYTPTIHIHSGLQHADGETKSPYFYDDYTFGKDYIVCRKEAINKFNNFLKEVEFLVDVNNFNL